MSPGPFERVAWVCVDGKTCPLQGSREVFHALRESIVAAGATNRVRICRSGCLAQCGHGPHVVVEPGSSWLAPVTPANSGQIVDHLINGTPVDELDYHPPTPGKNILKLDSDESPRQ